MPSSGPSCSADGTAEAALAPWSGGIGAARCGAAGGGREGGAAADGPRPCSSFRFFSMTGLGRLPSASKASSLIRFL